MHEIVQIGITRIAAYFRCYLGNSKMAKKSSSGVTFFRVGGQLAKV